MKLNPREKCSVASLRQERALGRKEETETVYRGTGVSIAVHHEPAATRLADRSTGARVYLISVPPALE
jgi:hypothetical protein